jgi:hypothetical protein
MAFHITVLSGDYIGAGGRCSREAIRILRAGKFCLQLRI